MADTLGIRSERLARLLIRGTNRGRFAGRSTPQTDAAVDTLAASRFEYAAGADLFAITGQDEAAVAGRRLLDVGCGYGGRTVYYAECGAAVVGLEPFESCLAGARAFAADRGVAAEFVQGFGEELPLPAASFDLAVAFDVLEHVRDPAAVIAEIARVVRPGGEAWLIFPSYLGARASHLDYVSRAPGLHRLFDPVTLAAAANREAERQGLATRIRASSGMFGRATISDSLNGMAARDAGRILAASPFAWTVRREPILEPRSRLPLGPQLSRLLALLGDRLPELLVGRVVATGVRDQP